MHRRLLSKWGNTYTRTVLRLSANDCTSGYRAYRADALRSIRPTTTQAEGYAFLTELVRRLDRTGFDDRRDADRLPRPRAGQVEDVRSHRGGVDVARHELGCGRRAATSPRSRRRSAVASSMASDTATQPGSAHTARSAATRRRPTSPTRRATHAAVPRGPGRRDWSGSASRRASSSTSNDHRSGNGSASASWSGVPTRNTFAPHWVS